jgi:hypothetical protein
LKTLPIRIPEKSGEYLREMKTLTIFSVSKIGDVFKRSNLIKSTRGKKNEEH